MTGQDVSPRLMDILGGDVPKAIVLHCLDTACGYRRLFDPTDFSSSLTVEQLKRRALCTMCGGRSGFGVSVECVHMAQPVRLEPHIAKAKGTAWLDRHKAYVASNPFAWRKHDGRWGHHRPSKTLICNAHVLLGIPMCNLFSNLLALDAMRSLFKIDIETLGNAEPLPAVFPDIAAPIVRLDEEGRRHLHLARCGWNKAKFGWVTNIRNLQGWPWKYEIEQDWNRCLVPATSFAEYHPTEKDENGRKKVVWFKRQGEDERPPFAFAGLWKRWNWDKDGLRKKTDQERPVDETEVIAFAFLTTDPNELVAPIHPKAMPVILTEDTYDTWLTSTALEAIDLQQPASEDLMEIAFVGKNKDSL
ncbi:MAG: SOS response-associated peptidase family protein [Pseudomonadota bacterium]